MRREIPLARGEVEDGRELGGKIIKGRRVDTRNADCVQQDGNLESRKGSTLRWMERYRGKVERMHIILC